MLAPTITNALTIDVEDYFQVSALAPYIRRDEWDSRECRVERNVDRILALLAERQVQATFFTLGWVAERYPQLVRRIVDSGHELASHGYGHERASDLSETAFREDITRSKHMLEDLAGCPVLGYRAPSFSIGTGNLWAFDQLARAGYSYSSSIYPKARASSNGSSARKSRLSSPRRSRIAWSVRWMRGALILPSPAGLITS